MQQDVKLIEIMKKNGISTDEINALHEVWGDRVEEPGLRYLWE